MYAHVGGSMGDTGAGDIMLKSTIMPAICQRSIWEHGSTLHLKLW